MLTSTANDPVVLFILLLLIVILAAVIGGLLVQLSTLQEHMRQATMTMMTMLADLRRDGFQRAIPSPIEVPVADSILSNLSAAQHDLLANIGPKVHNPREIPVQGGDVLDPLFTG